MPQAGASLVRPTAMPESLKGDGILERSARDVMLHWSMCVARIVLPNVVACSTLLDRKNVMPRRQMLSER